MSFKDLGAKADKGVDTLKVEGAQVGKEFGGMSKTLKYIIYAVAAIAILAMGSCMLKGCGSPKPMNGNLNPSVAYNEPVNQAPVAQAPQVVYVNNPDPMSGVLTGMAIGSLMSNGQRYDGHNGFNDSHYRGPSRTIKNVTVNNITVNKTVAAPVVAPVAPIAATPAAVAPVAAKKVNPGDAAAEQARKQDALKAELKAKQAARAAAAAPAPAAPLNLSKPAPKSNFNNFSKGASTRSSGGRRK